MKLVLALVFACVAGLAHAAPGDLDPARLRLASQSALVLDPQSGQPIYAKAADDITPIASLTKLMTAMVLLDGGQSLEEAIEVDMDDFDFLKGSSSRLRMGTVLPRGEMLRLALMSSENRAASSLARHYPGGTAAFVAAMNAKATSLGMTNTRYVEPTGLSPNNVSTANDLARLVKAAYDYPLIRDYSTTPSAFVETDHGRVVGFNNTNRLVKSGGWDIMLQKTGYIREAGRCLVMMANIASKPVVVVLLDSIGTYTRIADAERVKRWLETGDGTGPIVKAAVKAAKAITKPKAKSAVRGSFAPKLAREGRNRGV